MYDDVRDDDDDDNNNEAGAYCNLVGPTTSSCNNFDQCMHV